MELQTRELQTQTHGAKKYRASALLRSSAGLGWSTVSAELRSHGVGEMLKVVPQSVELCLIVDGNDHGLVRRKSAGQCQETVPRNGAIWLTPIGVEGSELTITAPLPKTMHLYLPSMLFRRLSDDFGLSGEPARSIRVGPSRRPQQIPLRADVQTCHRRFASALCQPDAAREGDGGNSRWQVVACADRVERAVLFRQVLHAHFPARPE